MARQEEGGSPLSSVCHPDKWCITSLASSPGGARQASGLPRSHASFGFPHLSVPCLSASFWCFLKLPSLDFLTPCPALGTLQHQMPWESPELTLSGEAPGPCPLLPGPLRVELPLGLLRHTSSRPHREVCWSVPAGLKGQSFILYTMELATDRKSIP